jgi:hypothetical protein
MAQDLTLPEVDNSLSDLGCVVGDTLDVPCGINQPQPGVDAVGFCNDVLLEQLEDGAVMAIDPFLSGHDGLSLRNISLRQGVKTVLHLAEGLEPEVLERLGDGKCVWIRGQLLDALGDVPSQISESLQVAVDPQNSSDASEIRGNWLVQGKDADALSFDLYFPPIDGRLLFPDSIGELDAAITQSVNALVKGVFDNRRKSQDLGPESFHVADEVPTDCEALLAPIPWGNRRIVFWHQLIPQLPVTAVAGVMTGTIWLAGRGRARR